MKEFLGLLLIFLGIAGGRYLGGLWNQPLLGAALGLVFIIPGIIIQIQGQRKRMWDKYNQQHGPHE